jgi:hypothetical protein
VAPVLSPVVQGTAFDEFRQGISAETFYVDHRQWKPQWADRWVAFADLLGFAGICERSAATTTNVLVRFHRCLSATLDTEPDVYAYRFTDAAYLVASDPVALLRACSTLQHHVLAMDVDLMSRRAVRAEHLLLVRITIAHGSVLIDDGLNARDDGHLGVDSASLLAGEGVVRAYRIERKASGFEIAVRNRDLPLVPSPQVRGVVGNVRGLLETWSEAGEAFIHDDVPPKSGVRTFPWELMRPTQGEAGTLWADEKGSVYSKLEHLEQVLDLNFGGYVTTDQPIDSIKHYGAITRRIAHLVQMLAGHKKIKRWTPTDIRSRVRGLPGVQTGDVDAEAH